MAVIRTIFCQFRLGDTEDPEIYAAGPMWDWQQTEHGKWCMENAIETPSYTIDPDYNTYGYKCTVWGKLEERDYTFHQLKWSNHVNFNSK